MSALRDEILTKYGIATPGTSGAGTTASASKTAAASDSPAAPAAGGGSLRDQILSKYLTPQKDKSGKVTGYQSTPAPAAPPAPAPTTFIGPADPNSKPAPLSLFQQGIKKTLDFLGIKNKIGDTGTPSPGDQERISGAAITNLLMQQHPEKIDPQVYFQRGLSFGHDLNPSALLEGRTAQPGLESVPEPVTKEQAFAQSIGNLVTISVAQPLIESAAVGLVSKIPGGGAVLKAGTELAQKSPWLVGYPVSVAKAFAEGGLFGLVTKNKETVAKNVLSTGGAFAAFTALAYPLQMFFRPVIESVGKVDLNPDLKKSLTQGIAGFDQNSKSAEIWFRNPKDPTQLLKVTAEGIEFVPNGGIVPQGVEAGNVTTLTNIQIEAFKENPSLYENLKAWAAGKLPSGRISFVSPEGTIPVENTAPGVQETAPGESGVPAASGAPGAVQTQAGGFKPDIGLPEGLNPITPVVKALRNAGYTASEASQIISAVPSKELAGAPAVDAKDVIAETQRFGPPQEAAAINTPASSDPGTATPQDVAKLPTNKPGVLDRIAAFTPEDAAAFGKQVMGKVNQELGLNLTEQQVASIPQGVVAKSTRSPDGRPAQFTPSGEIQLFLPNLAEDLRTLIDGGKILAHEGAHTQVFEMKPGETPEQLAVRYVREVLIHEKAHQKTIDVQDQEKMRSLRQDVIQAQATHDQNKITAAKTALESFMNTLETKANDYLKTNRAILEQDLFDKPAVKQPNKFERKALGLPENEKITISNKQLLKAQLEHTARVSEKVFKAGKDLGTEKAKAETTTRYEAAIKRIKDHMVSVEAKRRMLIDYAKDFVPAKSQGKFLKSIANVNSNKEFMDVLQRMKTESNLQERKALIEKIQEELKDAKIKKDPKTGKPKAKFSIEVQRDLTRIRKNAENSYALSREKIANAVAEFHAAHPDETLPPEIVHEIQLLRMEGVKEMSAKELRSVLADIQSLKETGKTAFEVAKFNRDTEIQRSRDAIIQVISGGKALPSDGTVFPVREEKLRGIKALMDKLTDFTIDKQQAFEDMMDIISKKEKGSRPYSSYLSEYTTNRTYPSFNKEFQGKERWIRTIREGIMQSYGLKEPKEILALYEDLAKKVVQEDVPMADGKKMTLDLTRDEAIQIYMWLQDPTLEGSFETGLNMGPEAQRAAISILTENDKKFADWMFENYYRPQYDEINKVFSAEFGVDMPFNENYSPAVKDVETVMPDNVLLAKEQAKYATARNANLKERTKNNVALSRVGAIDNMTRHVVRMEHYKAWSAAMQDLRGIFADKAVRGAVIDLYGRDTMKTIDNFINDFARGGVAQDKLVKWADNLRAGFTKSILGANPLVALKQLTGVMDYGIELPVADFFSGIVDFWKDPMGHSKFLFENSPGIQERFGEGFNIDIQTALDQGYAKQIARANSISEIMFWMIRAADKFTVYQGAWASYRSKMLELQGKGMSEADARGKAIQYAEQTTNRVQESSRIDTLSDIQRSGSLGKLFTMFASQQNKYWRNILNGFRNLKAGRGSKAENIRRILWSWLIVPVLYQITKRALASKKPGESFWGKEDTASIILGPLTQILILGDMVNWGMDRVAGKPFEYSPSPAFDFVVDFGNAAVDAAKFTPLDAAKATTEAIDGFGKLVGVPTGIVTKPVRNAIKDAKDSGPAPF